MWTIISRLLIKLIIKIVTDRVLVESAKSMLEKAVDSGVKKVGITNEDAQHIINTISESTLNTVDEAVTRHYVG